VAISRARNTLVVLADVSFIRQGAPAGSPVLRLLDRLEERAHRLDIEELFARHHLDLTALLQTATGRSPLPLDDDTTWVVDERDFFDAFAADAAVARESVVVFSPFCTEAGTTRWFTAITDAVRRGVAVRIVTRPDKGTGSGTEVGLRDRLARLRSMGCIVDERDGMHEKVAILDSATLWHGSLNILSHRDTTETMMRLVGHGACSQMEKVLLARWPGRDKSATLEQQENPTCPTCAASTSMHRNRSGIVFRCTAPGCSGNVVPGVSPTDTRLAGSGSACPNPACDGILIPRQGRHGAFLGCSRFAQTRCSGKPPRRT
jgi:hypothetical protein